MEGDQADFVAVEVHLCQGEEGSYKDYEEQIGSTALLGLDFDDPRNKLVEQARVVMSP